MNKRGLRATVLAAGLVLAAVLVGYFALTRDVTTPVTGQRGSVQPVAPGGGRAAAAGTGGVTPVPPYRPPTVDDPRLAAFVNREAPGERVFDDMAARFPQLTSARDVAAVATVLKDPADDDTVRHEAAALMLTLRCSPAPIRRPSCTLGVASFNMQGNIPWAGKRQTLLRIAHP